MFYGKRITELEMRVAALEERVKALAYRVSEQGNEIDSLLELYNKREEEKKAKAQQKQRRRYKNKKVDGKENTKATE